jgi:predicted dehydrogenase
VLPASPLVGECGGSDGDVATPNRAHADGRLECVAAGVPVIVEKPIADTVDSATRLVEAGERAGVPVLTGHHRNYSPIMAKAREIMRSGRLGRIVAVTASTIAAMNTSSPIRPPPVQL